MFLSIFYLFSLLYLFPSVSVFHQTQTVLKLTNTPNNINVCKTHIFPNSALNLHFHANAASSPVTQAAGLLLFVCAMLFNPRL